MIEVEIKVKIDDIEITAQKLLELGFVYAENIKETDVYYTSDHHDFRKLDEALRVRTIEDLLSGQKQSVITYKGPKLDDISMTRKEQETQLEDGDIMKNILTSIGFRPVPELVKVRDEYKLDDITVCLDNVDGLGEFLEIEILVETESDKGEALGRIEELLRTLGYSWEDTVRESYLSMLTEW